MFSKITEDGTQWFKIAYLEIRTKSVGSSEDNFGQEMSPQSQSDWFDEPFKGEVGKY